MHYRSHYADQSDPSLNLQFSRRWSEAPLPPKSGRSSRAGPRPIGDVLDDLALRLGRDSRAGAALSGRSLDAETAADGDDE